MPPTSQSSISASRSQEVPTKYFEMKLRVRADASVQRVDGPLHPSRLSQFFLQSIYLFWIVWGMDI